MTAAVGFTHVLVDFAGVAAPQLRDGTLLTGLLIAGAGAGGFAMTVPPTVRVMPSTGVAAVLLLEASHIVLHSMPDREMLLLDVLAEVPHDPAKVVEVFARRLTPREVHSETCERGERTRVRHGA